MRLDQESLKFISIILVCAIVATYFYKHHNKEVLAEKPPIITPIVPDQFVNPPEEIEPELPAIPTTYKEALAKAKKENKKLFLFFSKTSCGWCVKMKNETLKDKQVVAAMSKYVFFEIDAEKEPKIAEKYEVTYLPHYVIVNHDESVVKDDIGYKKVAEFLKWLNE